MIDWRVPEPARVTRQRTAVLEALQRAPEPLSAKNYRDLKLEGLGKTLKKRGRKPGSTSRTTVATRRRSGSRADSKAESA